MQQDTTPDFSQNSSQRYTQEHPREYSIALIGNPNCGKTTIFNNLTGARQKVGNWPGVTVEKKTGTYSYLNQGITITDLPGIYSLSPAPQNNSIDQEITNKFILHNKTDLYINILDATNLKRNLYLSLQLIALGLPCLIVINMLDKAKFKKLNIDTHKLSEILNCPVVALSSTQNIKNNTTELKEFIHNHLESKLENNLNTRDNPKDNLGFHNTLSIISNLGLNIELEKAQQQLSNFENLNSIVLNLQSDLKSSLEAQTIISKDYNYGTIFQLLEIDSELDSILDLDFDSTQNLIKQARDKIYSYYDEDPDILIADLRYRLINIIYNQAVTNTIPASTSSAAKTTTVNSGFTLDNIVLNKYLGIPIFLFILYSIFEISISLGEVLKPFFELPSQFITDSFVNNISYIFGFNYNLAATLSQGLSTGIVTVAGFIPQISLMFILLTFLEDSGYMARAAFVMDRLMQWAGLPGKSFVPLIISFGCNVPAIMSTRTLDSPRDRILTCLMSPFMSCSARLAIFIVFASAFFPEHRGLMVFLLYLTGILVAILTGLLLKSTLLNQKAMPFILELPSYNLPTLKNITLATWQRCKGFITRAGKLIIPICLVLQLLNSITPTGHWLNTNNINSNNIEQSVLSQAGKILTPVLNPIGVTNDNWPATVGLITGSLAKEVVVGTLNTLYNAPTFSSLSPSGQGAPHSFISTKNTDNFWVELTGTLGEAAAESKIRFLNLFSSEHYKIISTEIDNSEFSNQAFVHLSSAFPSTWAAFAYCLFVLLYMPCLSTFTILMKEIGKNWAIASLVWSLDIAYITATTVYQLSNIYQSPYKTLSIIGFIMLSHIIIYKYIKSGKLNNYFNINHYNANTYTA